MRLLQSTLIEFVPPTPGASETVPETPGLSAPKTDSPVLELAHGVEVGALSAEKPLVRPIAICSVPHLLRAEATLSQYATF
eukprot:SAG22_NODE_980_length_6173_cov_5.884261_1_plen_81_part_00